MTKKSEEWFADEEFWATVYPFLFPASSFEAATEQTPVITSLLGIEQGAILDLACGPGRHAVPLAERGYSVTGVDRSRFLLDRARSRAAERQVEVEWVAEDMRTFMRPGSFDGALSMFTSFGYFEESEQNLRVLENVFTSLKPGARFLMDVMGKEVLAHVFEPTSSRELSDGTLVIERRRVTEDWDRAETEWIFVRGESASSVRFRLWLYSGHELKQWMAQAGFSRVELFGDLQGAAYGPSAERLVALAWKDQG